MGKPTLTYFSCFGSAYFQITTDTMSHLMRAINALRKEFKERDATSQASVDGIQTTEIVSIRRLSQTPVNAETLGDEAIS